MYRFLLYNSIAEEGSSMFLCKAVSMLWHSNTDTHTQFGHWLEWILGNVPDRC